MKSRKLVDYELPYALLIPKIIEHFEIRVKDEVTDKTSVQRNYYITKKHVEKLGMKKIGNQWLMTNEVPPLDEDELENVEEQIAQQREPQWSPFETLMIQKMDSIIHIHQEHAAEVHGSLESIQNCLTNIETHLSLNEFDETLPRED